MNYPVVLTRRAEREMYAAARWWSLKRSAEQASRWLSGLDEQLKSLSQTPTRCPLAIEHEQFPYELRELHYGLGRRRTHRIVFTIRNEQVVVVAVRHAAQDRLSPEDLQ